jgi:hypothetical protein
MSGSQEEADGAKNRASQPPFLRRGRRRRVDENGREAVQYLIGAAEMKNMLPEQNEVS